MRNTESNWRDTVIVAILIIASYSYYIALSAKTWTWTFVSFDSGDWLAASTMWFVPQPYGSPLYILLGQFLNLFPGDMIIKMTVGLSCVPATITTIVVYLTIRKLGYSVRLAVTGWLVLMASAIFLSQATVLEEYAIASMFVSLAFYCYVSGKKKLTMLFLALGTAIHIIVAPIAFLWIIVNGKQAREWLKPLVSIYIPVVAVFYGFILFLMWMDTPNYIAGDLSLGAINAYLGSTGTIGKISLHDTPQRLWEAVRILLMSYGVAIIPFIYAVKKPWSWLSKVLLITAVFSLWIYITDTDMTTWTFTTFGTPVIVVGVAVGLAKMPSWCMKAVAFCAVGLILANSVMMNADRITGEYSEAVPYYESVQQIPNGSAVVIPKGGAYGLGLIYAISQGQEIVPVFMQHKDGWTNQGYLDYVEWIEEKEGVVGDDWIEQVRYCLENDKRVFVGYSVQPPEWQEELDSRYSMVDYNEYFKIITGIKKYTKGDTI